MLGARARWHRRQPAKWFMVVMCGTAVGIFVVFIMAVVK